MRWLYILAMELATWTLLVPFDLLRIALGKSSMTALRERLGTFAPTASSSARRLLVHAVSAGEMNAASALVHEMSGRGWRFILTAGNTDARAMAERIAALHSEVEQIIWFPWDRHGAMSRLLRATQADAVAVLETELWPGLFDAGRTAEVPIIIAGARIDRSAARRYRLVRPFFSPLLRGCSSILATNQMERERFIAIGAVPDIVEVAGDLKAEACLSAHGVDESQPRRGRLILAASTHPGEEEIILAAFGRVAGKFPDARLIIAPRKVGRAPSIKRLAGESVTVIDHLGVLAQLYLVAEVVIIGGTFVPVGGHELFGPAGAGTAVVIGPHYGNVQEIATAMARAGALVETTSIELATVLESLLDDERKRREMGERARQFVEARRGVARRTADRIEQLVSDTVVSGRAS